MASKRAPKASADNEIDELFADIDTKRPAGSAATGKTPVSAKPKPGDDILAELEDQLGEKAPSRPHTPRVREPTSKQRASLEQPQSATASRKSTESTRPLHASFTPSATSSDLQESTGTVEQQAQQQQAATAAGGWWGGFMSTATAAIKQAEAAVKEIQQNEEAKKWADQMRGNVGALRGLGKLPQLPWCLSWCRIIYAVLVDYHSYGSSGSRSMTERAASSTELESSNGEGSWKEK